MKKKTVDIKKRTEFFSMIEQMSLNTAQTILTNLHKSNEPFEDRYKFLLLINHELIRRLVIVYSYVNGGPTPKQFDMAVKKPEKENRL